MTTILTLLLALSFHRAVLSTEVSRECSLYLMPSIIPGAGRGIISGKKMTAGERIDMVSTIRLRDRSSHATQLLNYVFSTDENNYHMIKLGCGSLYNHQQYPNVQHNYGDDNHSATKLDLSNSNFSTATFDAYTTIEAGEEMSIYY